MPPITTLTMNPTLDLATTVDRVVPEDKLRCARPLIDPGGGGLNVARVITRLGGEAVACYTAGGSSGRMLQELVQREGIVGRVLPIEGATRFSFTVSETGGSETGGTRQFRFLMPGPDVTETEWHRCLDTFAALLGGPKPEYVVASGSLPPGVPDDFYAWVARIAREAGVRLVLDSSREPLRHALGAGIYLFKPNKEEVRQLGGPETGWPDRHAAWARDLIERGASEAVVLTRAADGALLVTRTERVFFPALDLKVKSAVGAGDSFIGGLILGLARGWPLRDACRLGMAASAATLLTPGTELCRREDTERFFAQVKAQPF